MVEGALKLNKKEALPLAMVFIDLAKAFDSISHELVCQRVFPSTTSMRT